MSLLMPNSCVNFLSLCHTYREYKLVKIAYWLHIALDKAFGHTYCEYKLVKLHIALEKAFGHTYCEYNLVTIAYCTRKGLWSCILCYTSLLVMHIVSISWLHIELHKSFGHAYCEYK